MQSRLCGYVGQRAAEWIIHGPVLPFKTSFIEFTESQVAPLPVCAPLPFYFKGEFDFSFSEDTAI